MAETNYTIQVVRLETDHNIVGKRLGMDEWPNQKKPINN